MAGAVMKKLTTMTLRNMNRTLVTSEKMKPRLSLLKPLTSNEAESVLKTINPHMPLNRVWVQLTYRSIGKIGNVKQQNA